MERAGTSGPGHTASHLRSKPKCSASCDIAASAESSTTSAWSERGAAAVCRTRHAAAFGQQKRPRGAHPRTTIASSRFPALLPSRSRPRPPRPRPPRPAVAAEIEKAGLTLLLYLNVLHRKAYCRIFELLTFSRSHWPGMRSARDARAGGSAQLAVTDIESSEDDMGCTVSLYACYARLEATACEFWLAAPQNKRPMKRQEGFGQKYRAGLWCGQTHCAPSVAAWYAFRRPTDGIAESHRGVLTPAGTKTAGAVGAARRYCS